MPIAIPDHDRNPRRETLQFSESDAALYAKRRAELNLIRTQVDAGRNGAKRQLLEQRLDHAMARAADVAARIAEARAV